MAYITKLAQIKFPSFDNNIENQKQGFLKYICLCIKLYSFQRLDRNTIAVRTKAADGTVE